MVIYEPDPPMGNPDNKKTILDYPELIEFIKQIDVAIDKKNERKNYGTIFNLLMEYIGRD